MLQCNDDDIELLLTVRAKKKTAEMLQSLIAEQQNDLKRKRIKRNHRC